MNTGKTDIEHSSDVMMQLFNRLAKRFIIYESKSDDSSPVVDYLTKLAGSIGYMAQINGAIHRSFKHEKRLKLLEERIKINLSIPMRMFEESQLEESQLEKYK